MKRNGTLIARPPRGRRRTLLALAGSLPLGFGGWGLGPARAATARQVVVVGAGWAGLAAVRALRAAAPELQVTLVDRQPVWRSLPLSNAWLAGFTPERLPAVPLQAWAVAQGAAYVEAEVQGIDRRAGQVHTSQGRLDYDCLLLATGAQPDHRAWAGGDADAAAVLKQRFPAGWAASELDAVKAGLARFTGGDLLLNVPAGAYPCPPAPYERALLLAAWMKRRGLAGRVVLVDAGGGMPRLTRLFGERWRGLIDYRPHTAIQRVDPDARELHTDVGVMRFDHALLLPPQHGGDWVVQAGLAGRDARGEPTRWAAADPSSLRSTADERIFVAGDVLDSVSPLFGAYPKTAHVAAALGAAAAVQMVAACRGLAAPAQQLPASECHVWLGAEPPEQLRLEARYRLRGDGLIAQTVVQTDNPQPRGEDLAWARALLASRLGID